MDSTADQILLGYSLSYMKLFLSVTSMSVHRILKLALQFRLKVVFKFCVLCDSIIIMYMYVCALYSSYYQKVPQELPELEKHQVYGLATPEDFTLPPHHTLWTEETYKAFEASSEASEKYDTKVCLLAVAHVAGESVKLVYL